MHRDGYELQPLLHSLHNIHPQQALPTPFRYITPTPCAFASSGCSQFSQRKRQVFEPLPSADFSNSLANCHWRLYLVRDQPSSFPPPSSSTSSSLQWNRPPVKRHLGNPGSVCFQADEAATRQHGMNDNRFFST